MNDVASGDLGPWLSPEELAFVRAKVPMLYVNIIPVKLDDVGRLSAVGLSLAASKEGITREIISGRVLYHESIRDAIIRHIDKDLGAMALPQLPATITPFTVGEYFPTPGQGWHDHRQHAVSLAYLIPMAGECSPLNDSLEFTWFTPGELRTPELQAEMSEADAALVRRALAYLQIF